MSSSQSRDSTNVGPTDTSTRGDDRLHASERVAAVKGPYKAMAFTDPFEKKDLTTRGNARLSAGASAFNPSTAGHGPSPITALSRDSTALQREPTIVSSTARKAAPGASDTASQQPIGTRGANVGPPRPRAIFTTDVGPSITFRGGHYIKISDVSPADMDDQVKFLTEAYQWQEKLLGSKAPPPAKGQKVLTLFYCFDHLKDAAAAIEEVEIVNGPFTASFITQAEYEGAPSSHGHVHKSSFYDGQVVFVATFDGYTSKFNARAAEEVVLDIAARFGKIAVFDEVQTASYPNLEFRAEYNRISAANAALEALPKEKAASLNSWLVYATEMPHYAPRPSSSGTSSNPSLRTDSTGETHHSATGRTAWRMVDGSTQPIAPPVSLPKVVPSLDASAASHRDRWQSAPDTYIQPYSTDDDAVVRPASFSQFTFREGGRIHAIGPQGVDVGKIQAGLDVRTTVMMRNIPNKMTVREFKEILDSTSFGRYDFSYLRIDFEQGTNVGYAFVNFADPMDIIAFVVAWVNKRWQANNKRCCEVSYATIQGLDCLIEKFRNSAIMSEFPDFRPKLWFTFDTTLDELLVGTEMEFPAPNNLSKKQRSLDNAGTIGLYAPHRGHESGERFRRSQFDRGTPAQIQEDAFQHPAANFNGFVMPPPHFTSMPMTPYPNVPAYDGGFVNGPMPYAVYDLNHPNASFQMHLGAPGFANGPQGPVNNHHNLTVGYGYQGPINGHHGYANQAPANGYHGYGNHGHANGRPNHGVNNRQHAPARFNNNHVHGNGHPHYNDEGPMPRVYQADEHPDGFDPNGYGNGHGPQGNGRNGKGPY